MSGVLVRRLVIGLLRVASGLASCECLQLGADCRLNRAYLKTVVNLITSSPPNAHMYDIIDMSSYGPRKGHTSCPILPGTYSIVRIGTTIQLVRFGARVVLFYDAMYVAERSAILLCTLLYLSLRCTCKYACVYDAYVYARVYARTYVCIHVCMHVIRMCTP